MHETDPAKTTSSPQAEADSLKSDNRNVDQSTASTPETESAQAKLEARVQDLEEQLLRAQAAQQNIQRIAAQDLQKIRRYGVETLLHSLLPVMDALEKAIQAFEITDISAPDAIQALASGVQMTLDELSGVMKASNATPIDPLGEPFDPERHQAASVRLPLESSDRQLQIEQQLVLEVLQKGWTLADRTLRPAMVVIAGDAK
ncbi:MAG: nucleotide exchange factor GrpE [Gammaproteobacteria bacterium]